MVAGKLTLLGISLLVATLVAAPCVLAADEIELKLLGLALHQDTGRDIYLGGIHFSGDMPRPDNLVAAAGPKTMEYRIVTRRTSIRSLLGSMMLQSELATGASPSPNTIRFANDIITVVQGSLYAGDSFRILLTEDDRTLAMLNGELLASIDNGFIADYFLEGWLGDKGAKTRFREQINNPTPDAALLALYYDNKVSADRLATVQSWTGEKSSSEMSAVSVAASPATVTDPQPASKPTPIAASDLETMSSPEAKAPELTLDESAVSAVVLEPDVIAVAEPEPRLTSAATVVDEQVQVASIAPTAALGDVMKALTPAADDMIQYSQRLAQFNDHLLRKVYQSVRYPKAAVRRGLQGSLEMDLVLDKSGKLNDIVVVNSSGYRILDEAAKRAAVSVLDDGTLAGIDEVIRQEYDNGDNALIIPVPITFRLTE